MKVLSNRYERNTGAMRPFLHHTAAAAVAAVLISVAAHGEAEIIMLSPDGPELPETWSFSEGPEFPGAAGSLEAGDDGVLQLNYDFTEGGNYVAAYRTLEEPLAVETVSFRMRKPATASFTVRVTDDAGQSFQKSAHYGHSDWQAVEFSLDGWTQQWGGPDDGILRQPIAQIGILLENEGLPDAQGTVELADVAAHGGDPETFVMETPRRTVYQVTDFADGAGFGVSGPAELSEHVWKADLGEADMAALTHSISLLGAPQELELTVSGGAPGNVLALHLGSHFQNFHRELGELTGETETFTVPVPPDGWDYYGGQDDGEVRDPLRVTRLELYRDDGPAEPVELELKELRCVTAVEPSESAVLVGAIEREDNGITLNVDAQNLLSEPLEGVMEVTWRDWEGAVLGDGRVPAVLPAEGASKQLSLKRSMPSDRHFVEAEIAFRDGGATYGEGRTTYTEPLDREPETEPRPESPWGMGVYLYRYPHTEQGLEQMDQAARMASKAGIKWSREEFNWATIETAPGEYDWSFYDEVVDTAERHGIAIYGLLAYWSDFTEPYTMEGIEDFAAFARAAAERYKGRVDHWQIYNEPNIFFWSGPRELYPVLLERCYEAIKDVNPGAEILGISTSGIDTDFITKCLEAEAPFDVLTVHPYRQHLYEHQFMDELRAVSDLVDNRPVWITEMGWSSEIGGNTEREQAQYLARTYLSAVASGAVENVSWYNFRSDGEDPFYNEHNFGVLRRDLTPKPAYRAAAAAASSFEDAADLDGQRLAEGLYMAQSGDTTAVWCAEHPITLECAIDSGEPSVTNLMGETVDAPVNDATLTLELRPGAPLFVEGARITPSVDDIHHERPEVFRF